jgi:choline dehydrogenase-like flavoprotein
MQTPKVLVQFGIGDRAELQRLGIPILQHLPGVGQNFQDHVAFDCVWEYQEPLPPHNNMSEANFYWKSDPRLDGPDLFACQAAAINFRKLRLDIRRGLLLLIESPRPTSITYPETGMHACNNNMSGY